MKKKDSKLNLSFYTGEDRYSDGDVEDVIYSIVQENKEYQNILESNDSWPIFYHLTPMRRNLLEWFDFDSNANLLEIGAGCGALTGLFCERVREVTAVELSKKRAEITEKRHEEHNNLEIIVGDIKQIKFDRCFDYVTLIGVMEYAGVYSQDSTPHLNMLNMLRKYLKPGGTLIIAIENKFGMKYWAGSPEDHTGRYFESIENYPGNGGIYTFSKVELEAVLNESGFSDLKFFYPMPDYKIPSNIYSDQYLPRIGELRESPNFDRDRLVLFDERLAFNNIIRNEMFPFFSNSYLVFAK